MFAWAVLHFAFFISLSPPAGGKGLGIGAVTEVGYNQNYEGWVKW